MIKFSEQLVVDEKLLLRPLSDSDAIPLNLICQDESFKRFLPELSELISELGVCHVLEAFVKYYADAEGILVGMEHAGIIVGFIACMDLKTSPIIFYAMHRQYRNCGIMTRALDLFLKYIFNRGICESVSTSVMKENLSSIAVLEKVGFKTIETDVNYLIMGKKK